MTIEHVVRGNTLPIILRLLQAIIPAKFFNTLYCLFSTKFSYSEAQARFLRHLLHVCSPDLGQANFGLCPFLLQSVLIDFFKLPLVIALKPCVQVAPSDTAG